jgi:hypothetical protein
MSILTGTRSPLSEDIPAKAEKIQTISEQVPTGRVEAQTPTILAEYWVSFSNPTN